jgi:hypothetical protein
LNNVGQAEPEITPLWSISSLALALVISSIEMKLRLSHKDYLLALGILVAVIVMMTTLVYTEVANPESKNREITPPRKTGLNSSPSVLLKRVFEKIDFKSLANQAH